MTTTSDSAGRMRTFWARVGAQYQKIKELAADKALAGDPTPGHVYIVSRDNVDRGVTAGQVVLATWNLAAQRIEEQTHSLATKNQVKDYLDDQAAAREAILNGDKARQARRAMESILGNNTQVLPAAGQAA